MLLVISYSDIDENKIREAIKNITFGFENNKKYKVRLLLNKWGKLKIESGEIEITQKKAKIILSKADRDNGR